MGKEVVPLIFRNVVAPLVQSLFDDIIERLRQLLDDVTDIRVRPGNDRFRRGERVVIHADPHRFKQMQTDRYGGWNDDMALVSRYHSSTIV